MKHKLAVCILCAWGAFFAYLFARALWLFPAATAALVVAILVLVGTVWALVTLFD
jgi:hypothetical protein